MGVFFHRIGSNMMGQQILLAHVSDRLVRRTKLGVYRDTVSVRIYMRLGTKCT